MFLDQTALEASKPGNAPTLKLCPDQPGDGYVSNNKYQPPWAFWIWHPPPFGVRGRGIPANTWVEVSHMAQGRESAGAWFMFSMGSGIWFNVGRTAVFYDHAAAHERFCGKCRGKGKKQVAAPVAFVKSSEMLNPTPVPAAKKRDREERRRQGRLR